LSLEKYLELRRLVDVLYDVQDVRMRTANRLRQMPKESSVVYVKPLLDIEKNLTDRIDIMLQDEPIYVEFLAHVRGIGPRIGGSIIAQTMIRFERVSKKDFEQAMFQVEPRKSMRAIRGVKTMLSLRAKENLEPTNRMRASEHMKPSSQVRATSSVKPTVNVRASGKMEPMKLLRFSKEQIELAQKTAKEDYLIPTIRGIASFDTISKYWAWWGYDVRQGHAPKRKRGDIVDWNPKMRTLGWKIEKQFVMQGEGYRTIYEQEKERLTTLRPTPQSCPHYEECKANLKKRQEPACKGHIEKMARRKAVKLFLSHLWLKWRRLEGLPVREPYVIEKLGHTTKIEPSLL